MSHDLPIAVTQPGNATDYALRYTANSRITGHGIDGATIHMPCPWCAAPDFTAIPLAAAHQALRAPATCGECGRSGRTIYHVDLPGHTETEFVQTAGPPPPDWLAVKPRRYPHP
jgi:hypothetical protein